MHANKDKDTDIHKDALAQSHTWIQVMGTMNHAFRSRNKVDKDQVANILANWSLDSCHA